MENEEDVLNLNEDADYMSGDELMDENGDDDEAVAVEDTLMSTAETRRKRGGKRRHSRCWKHFAIIGEKYPDGTNDVECKFCKLSYCLNLRRSGTSSLLLPGLVMDVATRWNSTHLMLDRAIIYREAFRQLAEVEACYQFCPNELEWERAELIRDFLAPFAEMTNLISGSSYPTANLYFMQVWMIENWLRGNEFSGDEVICEMVASMKPKFDKYWEEDLSL